MTSACWKFVVHGEQLQAQIPSTKEFPGILLVKKSFEENRTLDTINDQVVVLGLNILSKCGFTTPEDYPKATKHRESLKGKVYTKLDTKIFPNINDGFSNMTPSSNHVINC